ncbi:hypothetical protein KEJ27_07725 [Candidatus Bathyarchaeota archaeon]|nr:hypothetical protein [Candidatus Bathyarchaeota archaeon]MBS7613725.1 hypothetical protein [Candidatus Bathyarchaeota archaeon]MBS7618398.1 hypothetical protein [Candidatus Bathyarchaeota archaeon]
MNDELVASAALIAVKHALPSADCLQLASVASLKHALEPMKEKLVLVCPDKDLCRAAEEEEIELNDPEEVKKFIASQKVSEGQKKNYVQAYDTFMKFV